MTDYEKTIEAGEFMEPIQVMVRPEVDGDLISVAQAPYMYESVGLEPNCIDALCAALQEAKIAALRYRNRDIYREPPTGGEA